MALSEKTSPTLEFDKTISSRKKDLYCWKCHKPGKNMIECKDCVRVFHKTCMALVAGTSVYTEEWICPECQICSSEFLQEGITEKKMRHLLLLVIEQVKKCEGFEHFMVPVNLEEVVDYSQYIIYPMDFSKLRKNILNNKYKSPSSFLADAKWIYHNSYVFNSGQSDLTTYAKAITRIMKSNCADIEVCYSCFQHACYFDHDWTVRPCLKPHIPVWAHMRGYPYWPAVVLKFSGNMVTVRFFGDHPSRATLPTTSCFLYTKALPKAVIRPSLASGLDKARKEADCYVQNLQKAFELFVYPPAKTVLDAEKEDEQRLALLPKFLEVTKEKREASKLSKSIKENGVVDEKLTKGRNKRKLDEDSCEKIPKTKRRNSKIEKDTPLSSVQRDNKRILLSDALKSMPAVQKDLYLRRYIKMKYPWFPEVQSILPNVVVNKITIPNENEDTKTSPPVEIENTKILEPTETESTNITETNITDEEKKITETEATNNTAEVVENRPATQGKPNTYSLLNGDISGLITNIFSSGEEPTILHAEGLKVTVRSEFKNEQDAPPSQVSCGTDDQECKPDVRKIHLVVRKDLYGVEPRPQNSSEEEIKSDQSTQTPDPRPEIDPNLIQNENDFTKDVVGEYLRSKPTERFVLYRDRIKEKVCGVMSRPYVLSAGTQKIIDQIEDVHLRKAVLDVLMKDVRKENTERISVVQDFVDTAYDFIIEPCVAKLIKYEDIISKMWCVVCYHPAGRYCCFNGRYCDAHCQLCDYRFHSEICGQTKILESTDRHFVRNPHFETVYSESVRNPGKDKFDFSKIGEEDEVPGTSNSRLKPIEIITPVGNNTPAAQEEKTPQLKNTPTTRTRKTPPAPRKKKPPPPGAKKAPISLTKKTPAPTVDNIATAKLPGKAPIPLTKKTPPPIVKNIATAKLPSKAPISLTKKTPPPTVNNSDIPKLPGKAPILISNNAPSPEVFNIPSLIYTPKSTATSENLPDCPVISSFGSISSLPNPIRANMVKLHPALVPKHIREANEMNKIRAKESRVMLAVQQKTVGNHEVAKEPDAQGATVPANIGSTASTPSQGNEIPGSSSSSQAMKIRVSSSVSLINSSASDLSSRARQPPISQARSKILPDTELIPVAVPSTSKGNKNILRTVVPLRNEVPAATPSVKPIRREILKSHPVPSTSSACSVNGPFKPPISNPSHALINYINTQNLKTNSRIAAPKPVVVRHSAAVPSCSKTPDPKT